MHSVRRNRCAVVDPYGGGTADVVLDADPESTVGDIAEELAKQVGVAGAQVIPIGHQGQAGAGSAPLVYVDGYAVDPSATVVGSPLREGAVVSLQDPSGCLPGEPTGLVASEPLASRPRRRPRWWSSPSSSPGTKSTANRT